MVEMFIYTLEFQVGRDLWGPVNGVEAFYSDGGRYGSGQGKGVHCERRNNQIPNASRR